MSTSCEVVAATTALQRRHQPTRDLLNLKKILKIVIPAVVKISPESVVPFYRTKFQHIRQGCKNIDCSTLMKL